MQLLACGLGPPDASGPGVGPLEPPHASIVSPNDAAANPTAPRRNCFLVIAIMPRRGAAEMPCVCTSRTARPAQEEDVTGDESHDRCASTRSPTRSVRHLLPVGDDQAHTAHVPKSTASAAIRE